MSDILASDPSEEDALVGALVAPDDETDPDPAADGGATAGTDAVSGVFSTSVALATETGTTEPETGDGETAQSPSDPTSDPQEPITGTAPAITASADTGSTEDDEAAPLSVSSAPALSEPAAEPLTTMSSPALPDGGAAIRVGTAAELKAALAGSTGGEVIILEGGDYGSLYFGHKGLDGSGYADTVTLRAADHGAPPVFSSLILNGVQNLELDGLAFSYDWQEGHHAGANPFQVNDSSGIAIRNATFTGDNYLGPDAEAYGYPAGKGLTIANSSDVLVSDSSFTTFWKGIGIGASDRVTLIGNELSDMRSDGINFAQVTDILVENNHIHDFRINEATGDHPDMIQMWTANTTARSTGITIRGNLLDIGDGGVTHAMLLEQTRSTAGTVGDAGVFENILIEDNVIVGAHPHGITVGETEGLTIRDNTLLAAGGISGSGVPRINVSTAATGVSVTGNVTHDRIVLANPGAEVSGNFMVQNTDPDAPGYYGDNFVNALTDTTNALPNLQVRPGSALDLAGAGSSLLEYDAHPDTRTPLITSDMPEARNVVLFDASLSAGPLGALADQGGRFTWDFGDGTTGAGVQIAHRYATPGIYTARLSVEMPDGTLHHSNATVEISAPRILWLDAEQGALVAGSADGARLLNTTLALSDTEEGSALRLTRDSQQVVTRSTLAELFGSAEFDFTADIRVEGSGELLRQHTAFQVDVTGGELRVMLATDDGSLVSLTSSGAGLDDGEWHRISIGYDAAAGRLDISADGTIVGTAAASGNFKSASYWDMTLGRVDSRGMIGEIRDLALDVEKSRYAEMDPTVPETGEIVLPGDPTDAGSAEDPVEAPGPVGALGAALDTAFETSDYGADFDEGTAQLFGSAHLSDGALILDGTGGQALGRLSRFTDAAQMAIRLEFDTEHDGRLLWNHTRLGVAVRGDGLSFDYATEGSSARQHVGGLGIDDGMTHELVLLRDLDRDIFAAILDDEIIFTDTDRDLTADGARSFEYGWALGGWQDDYSSTRIEAFEMVDLGEDPTAFDAILDWLDAPTI